MQKIEDIYSKHIMQNTFTKEMLLTPYLYFYSSDKNVFSWE